MLRSDRIALAARRLERVLHHHGIATMRTLEQKISDAGPTNQRVDPHVLTTARNTLFAKRLIRSLKAPPHSSARWYYWHDTPHSVVDERLSLQLPIFLALCDTQLGKRIGQTLEIAVYRALLTQSAFAFLGGFPDLDKHDDSTPYIKSEPPSLLSGRTLPGNQKLDFILSHPTSGWIGFEVKNVREWLYPDRTEIKNFLFKCVTLDCVPVLIARRIPYASFSLFLRCGVIVHQTYNQLFPTSAYDIAEKAKHKTLLGYHDIRIGNFPDARLLKFLHQNLPIIVPQARTKFDRYKDLLGAFSTGEMPFKAFAAGVRRRSKG